jgi:hypothetical protein
VNKKWFEHTHCPGLQKFISLAVSHPRIAIDQNKRNFPSDNLRLSNLSFEGFRFPSMSTLRARFKKSGVVRTFRISMEERAAIQFLTLKGLPASVLAAQLELE